MVSDDIRPFSCPQAAERGPGGEVELTEGSQHPRLCADLPHLHPKMASLRVNALQGEGKDESASCYKGSWASMSSQPGVAAMFEGPSV